ncbi:MAG TPA: patatin-like phospholipase family protein [Patescibacteria group bacterium]|nr:patatin-like phospholipase family protein [Patescibacteria group bacterium]
MINNKKIGLALGSGGARGLAHIGVIKVLEANNIPIDFIAGASIGALIGSAYATHQDIKLIEKTFLEIEWKKILHLSSDLSIFSGGLVGGDRVKYFMESELRCAKEFSKLKIPFAAVATDMSTGEDVFLTTGNLIEAVRASISLPGFFKPVEIAGRHLIDGGAVDPVPVDLAKKIGAKFVIAVNLEERGCSYLHAEKGSKNLYNNVYSAARIMQKRLATYSSAAADILLSPEVGRYAWTQVSEAKKIIAAGEDIARQNIARIIELLNR